MTRLDGPNNTIHNFLDMACSGFSENAKKRFKKNQEHEKRIREENRLRRQGSRDGISTSSPLSSSISVPAFVPATREAHRASRRRYQTLPGLIPRRPKSGERSRLQVTWPPASVQTALSKVESQAALPQHTSRLNHTTRPRQARTQSEPQVSSPHNCEPPAFPAIIYDNSTVRVPTAEALLMDPHRTLMEGLRMPTGLHSELPKRSMYNPRWYGDHDDCD